MGLLDRRIEKLEDLDQNCLPKLFIVDTSDTPEWRKKIEKIKKIYRKARVLLLEDVEE
jgi:cell division protein FtsX